MERLATDRLQYLLVAQEANVEPPYVTFWESAAMARELLELRAQVASDDVQEREHLGNLGVRPGIHCQQVAYHTGPEPALASELDDDPIVPSPPLGRELGRSPIPTPRRREREALLSIARASCEVDTVRKAALALLGEVQP